MESEEPEENITHMDAPMYKAAAEGNIEVFNNKQGLQLELLKTSNYDNVLHVNLANQENDCLLFKIFLSIAELFPLQGTFLVLRAFIHITKEKRRSNFIKQILSKCPSLLLQTNARDQTPLHVAARYGHSAVVKLLIKSYAKPRDGDLEKLGTDQENAVREMLRIRDQESNTALHEAARSGNVEVVKALLEFEDPDFPYSANKKQETPVYIAAKRRGSGRLLTLLLDKFKSTGHGGPHGRTTLHAAAMAGDAEAIRVILERKGNLTKERDEDGHTPLHYAAHLGFNSVVEVLLKRDVSAAYVGDKKRGMTPLLMAARQGYFVTVSKILSLCPDCCEEVDNKGLNLLHYQAFRNPLRQTPLEPWDKEYGSVRNLMELEGACGMKPQEVYNVFGSEKHHHHKQKQIKELLEEIQNDQVAEEPVRPILLPTISAESLDKTREAHLIVAALISTVAFAATITVPGGLESEKGSKQGTPLLIHEAASKAFFVTNAMAFIFSVSVLSLHLGVLDNLLFGFRHEKILKRTRFVTTLLGYATIAMVIAFNTGSYVILKPSHGLAVVSCLICLVFVLCIWLYTSE